MERGLHLCYCTKTFGRLCNAAGINKMLYGIKAQRVKQSLPYVILWGKTWKKWAFSNQNIYNPLGFDSTTWQDELFYKRNTYGCIYHVRLTYSSSSSAKVYFSMIHTLEMSVHWGICLHRTHICYAYHRPSRLHLSLHETGDLSPASWVWAARWQCNWVTRSNKSNLLRILHKKLRC